MKLICDENHSWYGGAWSVCPFCRQPAIKARDMKRLEEVIREVIQGVERSVVIHGEWPDYSRWRVLRVVAAEFWEVAWAVILNRRGAHGMVDELRDLAVVSVKGMIRLRGVEK